MRTVYLIALILTIVGGVNWGLVGLFNYDLVAYVFGDNTVASRLIYDIVGVSAAVLAVLAFYVQDRHTIAVK